MHTKYIRNQYTCIGTECVELYDGSEGVRDICAVHQRKQQQPNYTKPRESKAITEKYVTNSECPAIVSDLRVFGDFEQFPF